MRKRPLNTVYHFTVFAEMELMRSLTEVNRQVNRVSTVPGRYVYREYQVRGDRMRLDKLTEQAQ